MRDTYRSQPQDGDVRHDERDNRHRRWEVQRHDYHQSRQDYSRSPPRQDFNDQPSREVSSRVQNEIPSENGFDHYRYIGNTEGSTQYIGPPRGPASQAWTQDDYDRMYDDNRRDGDGDRFLQYDNTRSYGSDTSRRDHTVHRRRSISRHRRSRSRSRSPTREAGRPSDTIILEGLPFSITQTELRDSLLNDTIASEFPSIDVRISAAQGSRRAFVQFTSVEYAVDFVKKYFPRILIDLRHSTDEIPEGKFQAFLHYARNRDGAESRNQETRDWVCPQCEMSNFASRSKCRGCGSYPSGLHWHESLTGEADASDVPSQILVVYPLAPLVDEETLGAELKKLELEKPERLKDTSGAGPKLKSTAPTNNAIGYGARPGSLHRVFLMRDANNDESFKYGFAEFWTIEDAAAAMTKFRMSRTFTVAACAVNVSTIHMGVFLPEERELTPTIERMSFHPLFNPSLRVRYRDHHVYPSQHLVALNSPDAVSDQGQEDDHADGKKAKKRKADGSLPSSTKKKPMAMAGKMAVWQRKHDELHAGSNANNGTSQDSLNTSSAETPSIRKDPLNARGKEPIKLSISNSISISASSSKAEISTDARDEKTSSGNQRQQSESPLISYVDRDRLMCLICMRKYKSVDEVNIHEKSRNHKTATDDDKLVKAALPRLAARDKRLLKQQPADLEDREAETAQNQSQYRDRAKERRQAYNQPKKPDPIQSRISSTVEPSKQPLKGASPEEQVAKPASSSKGAGMLAKMGWTAGAGLGAKGEGRTDVIATNAYQEGVGLGAEGGNLGDAAELAGKKTRNTYAEYVNTVQDKARQRYNKLG